MKGIKKLVSAGLILGLCLAFVACGGKQEGATAAKGAEAKKEAPKKTVTIKIANYYAEAHPQNIALRDVFKPMIEKDSNGGLAVEIYPNNQLGAEKEFIEGTKLGTIEMSVMGMLLADKYPRMKLVEFPYIFDNVDKGFKLLNGEIGAEITDGLTAKDGIRALAWDVNGVRAVSNSKKPINTLADCKDIKLRVPQVKHYIDTGKALGFSVVTMPMSEIFTALQQKVIDGQENPPTTVLTSGWHEVQKYIALTNHMIAYNIIAINEKFYQTLTPDQQKVIENASKAFAQKELDLYKEAATKDVETLKSKGIQFTTPDLAPFRKACQTVHDTLLKEFPDIKSDLRENPRQTERNVILEAILPARVLPRGLPYLAKHEVEMQKNLYL